MAKYYKNRCDRERPRCKPLGVGKDCWTPKQIKRYGLNTQDISPERCLEDRQKEIEQKWRECIFTKLANEYGASPYDEDQASREPRKTPPETEDMPDVPTVKQPKKKPTAGETKENQGSKTKAEKEKKLKARQDKEFSKWKPGATIPTPETDEEIPEEQPEQGKRPPAPRKPDGDPDAFPDAEFDEAKIKTTIWEAITAVKARCARKIQDDNLLQELRSCFCGRIDCGEDDKREDFTVSRPRVRDTATASIISPATGDDLSSRLQELFLTGSAYGVPIEQHFGLTHSLGNIIFITPSTNYLQDEQPLLAEIITGVARVTPYVIGPAVSFGLSLGAEDSDMDVYRIYFDNVIVYDADTSSSSLGFFVGEESVKTSKISLHNSATALPDEMQLDGIGYRDLSFLFFRNIDVTAFKAFPDIRVLLRRKEALTYTTQALTLSMPLSHVLPVSDDQAVMVTEESNVLIRATHFGTTNVVVPNSNWRDTSEASGSVFVTGRKVLNSGTVVESLFSKNRVVGSGKNDLRIVYSANNATVRELYLVVDDDTVIFKRPNGTTLTGMNVGSAVLSTTTATYLLDNVVTYSLFIATASTLREVRLRNAGSLESPLDQFTDTPVQLTHTFHSIVATPRGLLFIGSTGISLREWGTNEDRKISSIGAGPIKVSGSFARVLFGNTSGIYSLNTFTEEVQKLSDVAISGAQLYTGASVFSDTVFYPSVSNAFNSLADVANEILTRAILGYSTVEDVTDFLVLGVKLSTLEEQAALSRLFNYTAEERNETLTFDSDFSSWETIDKAGDDIPVKSYSLEYFDVEGNVRETNVSADVSKLTLPLYLDASSATYLTGIVSARLNSETKINKVRLAPKYLSINPPSVFSVNLGHDLVSETEVYSSKPTFPGQVAANSVASVSGESFYPVYLDISPVFAEDGSDSTLRVSGYVGAVGTVVDLTLLAFGDDGLAGSGTVVRAMNVGTLVSDNSIARPDVFSYQNPDDDFMIVTLGTTDRLYNFPRDEMNEATNATTLYRNILAVGREWIRFSSFTATGNPGEYKIEGLRRGLFNTEMYNVHDVGERVVHYDPGAFAPITMAKNRVTGEIGVSAFDNTDEDAPPVVARYAITKHTSYLPPNYGDKGRDAFANIGSPGFAYAIKLFARNKLPVPLADAASVYGEISAPNQRYIYAWLVPGTIVDEALFQHIVDNAASKINSSASVIRQVVYIEPILFSPPPSVITAQAVTVVWKTVTDETMTRFGHWTVGTLDFTNLGYPVKQSVFTVEEP